METVNIRDAKTHLWRLLAQFADGDSVVIARAGKPVACLVPVEPPAVPAPRRLGFMAGQLRMPDDFDRMGQDEVEALFGGRP
ncbi:prevent-host-death protein [Croceibacterium mercuriale]|uniref:Antitoxin n=1 Tax=Croceibacterium mercuriale TaxID=1572751 RepID=A0A0B2BRY8_9SPHN|nr:type II toxin-antitoxin system prevent-host-death family antitoxin [Croceibacterium mercuriale]KHL24141.1 prevent-host-death protein [Croceibacterium mercuriale]